MAAGLLGNESPDSNRFIHMVPKPENGVRLYAMLGNQNPTGLPVGAVSYPDFTIINPSTGKIYIYEHFGMLDDEGYFDKFIRKLVFYKNNAYIVGNNYFMTYETSTIPFDVREVNRIIDVIKNDIEDIFVVTENK